MHTKLWAHTAWIITTAKTQHRSFCALTMWRLHNLRLCMVMERDVKWDYTTIIIVTCELRPYVCCYCCYDRSLVGDFAFSFSSFACLLCESWFFHPIRLKFERCCLLSTLTVLAQYVPSSRGKTWGKVNRLNPLFLVGVGSCGFKLIGWNPLFSVGVSGCGFQLIGWNPLFLAVVGCRSLLSEGWCLEEDKSGVAFCTEWITGWVGLRGYKCVCVRERKK